MAVSIAERRHVFSFAGYVDVVERSPTRIEHWEGAILDMSGGPPRHSAICSNVSRILGARLRGAPCTVFDAHLRVRAIGCALPIAEVYEDLPNA